MSSHSVAAPYQPRDKECALVCICFAIRECCHQEEIDVKYRDIKTALHGKYNDFWRRQEEKACMAFPGDDVIQSLAEKESIEAIQGSETVQRPGIDIAYNLSFFTGSRYWISVPDRTDNYCDIKIRIGFSRH